MTVIYPCLVAVLEPPGPLIGSVEFTKYQARQRCRRTKARQSTNVGSPLQYQAVTGTGTKSIIETHFKSKQWMTCDFEERTASR
jgi:hypothetical protein